MSATLTSTPAFSPPIVSKGGESSANNSVAGTEISDFSLDVAPPPARTPISKMFSCCFPKPAAAAVSVDQDDEEVTTEVEKENPIEEIESMNNTHDDDEEEVEEMEGTATEVVDTIEESKSVPVDEEVHEEFEVKFVEETDAVDEIELTFDEPIVEKTREIELEEEEEEQPEPRKRLALGRAVMSVAVVGAAVGAIVANGLAQAV